MNYNLSDPREVLEFIDITQKAIQSKWRVRLTRATDHRSTRQNSYLHFLCSYFATQYGCTKVEAKEIYLKRQAAPQIFAQKVTNKYGREIVTYRSTADLDVRETSSAIANFIAWAAIGGYNLPQPDDYAFRREAEKEIEQHQGLI